MCIRDRSENDRGRRDGLDVDVALVRAGIADRGQVHRTPQLDHGLVLVLGHPGAQAVEHRGDRLRTRPQDGRRRARHVRTCLLYTSRCV